MMMLHPFEEVMRDFRLGKFVIIIDDSDREDEGDLTVAAELLTEQGMNFMLQEGKGLVCLSLTEERLKQLGIPLQVAENSAPLGTNFSVSIDHKSVALAGVTARGRVATIRAAVSYTASSGDFNLPGYVFPLSAVGGGVLRRRGQTEASVDLARIAGLTPAAVICEIMDENGDMLRGEALVEYAKKWGIKITSVEAILRYRLKHEVCLRRVSECRFSDITELGILSDINFSVETVKQVVKVFVYVDDVDDKEHLAFVVGEPKDGCLARIHSECLTGDVFESQRCDCGSQLLSALTAIINEGAGVIVYLHQEGRGIGLGNKLRAYELQELGRDTVDANLELGFAADARDYRVGAQILADLGLHNVRLMTNNPDKVQSVERFEMRVLERVPILTEPDKFNLEYIKTKKNRMGHLIPDSAQIKSSNLQ